MFKLFLSIFRRITTAVTNPFRMLIVRIQRMFNINIITAKLISPLTKKVKSLITLKPQSRSDYYVAGRWWIYKKLLLTLVLVLCAGVFIYFTMFASKLPTAVTAPTAVTTDITYDYDDMDLQKFTGVANVRASDGKVVYTGDIKAGVCEGNGTLWNREGKLLYKGGFAQNKYSGDGISYYPDGSKKYEGSWASNLYQGEGSLFAEDGTLLYEGSFLNGKYDGEGKAYNADGKLLYEGTFSAGFYHGVGISFYPDGVMHYKGDFYQGKPQGSGQLYSEAGKLLYTGDMLNGEINYRSLLSSNYADIRKAFAETPRIFYSDVDSTFVFEQAGVIVTLECRVKIDTWEKPAQQGEDSPFYYMPGDLSAASQAVTGTADTPLPPSLSLVYLRRPLRVVPLAWYVDDGSSSSSPSQNDDSSSASSSSSEGSSSAGSSSSSSEASVSSQGPSTPEFIEKNQTVYFEIDANVWQSEKELDAEKVQVKKVTVFSGFSAEVPPEAVKYDDNIPPSIEDCVAIDFIRQKQPTAFAQIMFEVDRQNRLFMRLSNINFAEKVDRRAFLVNDIIYHYCYQKPTDKTPLYFSVER